MAGLLLRIPFMVVIAAMSSAAAGGFQRDTQPSGAASGVIRGRVVAEDTGAPVRDATVILSTGERTVMFGPFGAMREKLTGPSTQVDGDGRFEFVGLQPGWYRLSVDPAPSAARYVSALHPAPDSDDPQALTLSPKQVLDGVVVRLPRAAVITGRIVNDRGDPVARVPISVQVALLGGRLRPTPGSEVRTDDTGAFRVFGLSAGDYVVAAEPPPVRELKTTESYRTTYYPGTVSLSEAARIRVRPGDEYGPIDFALSRARLLTIRGVILNSAGERAAGVTVSPERSPVFGVTPVIGTRPTGEDGAFVIERVMPGAQVFIVNHVGRSGLEYARVPLTLVDDIDGLTIRLQAGVSVRGHVVFEGQAPASLAALQVQARDGARVSVGIQPAADRSFTLEPLFGPTAIRVSGLKGWHLKSVLYGARDITDDVLEFSHGGPDLQVILTQRAATIRGTVTTAKGAPIEAAVVVFSEDPALWNERATTTKVTYSPGDGKYTLDGLRSGRYLAVAVPRDDAMLSPAPQEYFELLATHAVRVVLAESESKSLDLKLTMLR